MQQLHWLHFVTYESALRFHFILQSSPLRGFKFQASNFPASRSLQISASPMLSLKISRLWKFRISAVNRSVRTGLNAFTARRGPVALFSKNKLPTAVHIVRHGYCHRGNTAGRPLITTICGAISAGLHNADKTSFRWNDRSRAGDRPGWNRGAVFIESTERLKLFAELRYSVGGVARADSPAVVRLSLHLFLLPRHELHERLNRTRALYFSRDSSRSNLIANCALTARSGNNAANEGLGVSTINRRFAERAGLFSSIWASASAWLSIYFLLFCVRIREYED